MNYKDLNSDILFAAGFNEYQAETGRDENEGWTIDRSTECVTIRNR